MLYQTYNFFFAMMLSRLCLCTSLCSASCSSHNALVLRFVLRVMLSVQHQSRMTNDEAMFTTVQSNPYPHRETGDDFEYLILSVLRTSDRVVNL